MKRRSLLKALGLAPLAGLFAREAAKAAEPVPLPTPDPITLAAVPDDYAAHVKAHARLLEDAYGRTNSVARGGPDDAPQAVSLDGWRAVAWPEYKPSCEHEWHPIQGRYGHRCSKCGNEVGSRRPRLRRSQESTP